MTPKLTLAQAQLSMKPLTDFASSLGNIATTNTVNTVQGFYQVYDQMLKPTAEPAGASEAVGGRLIPSTREPNTPCLSIEASFIYLTTPIPEHKC